MAHSLIMYVIALPELAMDESILRGRWTDEETRQYSTVQGPAWVGKPESEHDKDDNFALSSSRPFLTGQEKLV
jgi:hypothetical protein